MKLIPIKGHYEFAYVDDSDYDLLSRYDWHLSNGYTAWSPGDGKRIFMHRLVSAAHDNTDIDHIDTNKLNNQHSNLRRSSKKLNSANRNKQKGDYTSKHKGVCAYNICGKLKKFRAYIFVDYKQIHLGIFDTQVEAAKAYDKAALKHFGEHARFNFPNFFVPSIEEE